MPEKVRELVAPIVAALLVLFLVGVTLGLFGHLNMPQPEWDRSLYLLNGAEAVGFAAAGYLFGKEVNRGRAEKAEEREEKAEQRSKTARYAAETGRNLARAVLGKKAVKSGGGSAASRYLPESAATTAQLDLDELAVLADEVLKEHP